MISIMYLYCVYRCNIHRVVETENQPLMYIGVHVVYMLSYLCTQVLEINLRVQTMYVARHVLAYAASTIYV